MAGPPRPGLPKIKIIVCVVVAVCALKINTAEAKCREDEFQCKSGRCIANYLRCNFVMECSEGEDEQGCPCLADEFACAHGECIEATLRCDGRADCPDGSDEDRCEPTTTRPTPPTAGETRCPHGQFACADNTQCVDERLRCDSNYNCRDGSDERNCPEKTCSSDQFRCPDGTCLNIAQRCDGAVDCRGGEDEHSCREYTFYAYVVPVVFVPGNVVFYVYGHAPCYNVPKQAQRRDPE